MKRRHPAKVVKAFAGCLSLGNHLTTSDRIWCPKLSSPCNRDDDLGHMFIFVAQVYRGDDEFL